MSKSSEDVNGEVAWMVTRISKSIFSIKCNITDSVLAVSVQNSLGLSITFAQASKAMFFIFSSSVETHVSFINLDHNEAWILRLHKGCHQIILMFLYGMDFDPQRSGINETIFIKGQKKLKTDESLF